MVLVFILMAFVIGLVIPLQSAINSSLRDTLHSGSVLAALVSFAVGTLALLVASVLTGQPFAALGGLPRVAWWEWLGGALGAFFVFGSTLLAPRIGVAAMIALIVAGQVISSLVFDRYGLLGLPVRGISGIRLAGAVLILAGAVLVNFGDRWLGSQPS
ncbi:DMT family transporter [Geothrix sp.]|jgi:transporter family-2 protein|uniref:DMT family transporter n=1 Tax=Geothrix sp. TaxID=1962974 RepID=UPI0025B82346|nr:DMT family transporter [Geothrix sp.]